MTEDSRCGAVRPSPEREVGDSRLGSGDAHPMAGAIDSGSSFPPVDDRLVANGIGGNQRLDSGPKSLKGHAAIRLGNKHCGMFWRQNNDSTRSDALAGSIVGNGRNVVNTGSQGDAGSMVGVSINVGIHNICLGQATKSIIGKNKQNNTFFQVSQEHDHSVIGGASDASNAAVNSGRRAKENGSGVFIGDESTKSGERIWVAQHLGLVAKCRGHRSELGQRVNVWAIGVAKTSVAEPEEAGKSLGGHGQKRSFDWIASS